MRIVNSAFMVKISTTVCCVSVVPQKIEVCASLAEQSQNRPLLYWAVHKHLNGRSHVVSKHIRQNQKSNVKKFGEL